MDYIPHVTETARRKLDSWGMTQFRVTGELGVGCAIMQELFGRESTFKSGEDILSSDTVAYSHPISDKR